MIDYADTLDGVTPDMLQGFFVGWRSPRTPVEHFEILRRSDLVVLAIDTKTDRVVGFVTALTDRVQAAFVPLIEVLPEFRGRGIGSELMRRILDVLGPIPCVDLTCDPKLQGFYRRLGMAPSVGMILRRT
ncbi:MAG: GNAT family N-acetyltransferase [Candidatus Bipolaricaulia bacterium]